MKITYLNCNEAEQDIRIDSDIDLNDQISKQDEQDLRTVHRVHQIIQSRASHLNVILRQCSYNITSGLKNEIEFDLVFEGHPSIIAMLMVYAHYIMTVYEEIDLDLFHGTVKTHWNDKEAALAFNAESVGTPTTLH